jgi:hypothetical protein
MEAQVVEFRSGEPRATLFGAVCCVILILPARLSEPEDPWVPLVLGSMAAFGLWSVARRWKVPVVRLTEETLEVYKGGKAAQFVPFSMIVSVETKLNSTVLKLRNGATIEISHTDFLWSADAKAFTAELRNRVAPA